MRKFNFSAGPSALPTEVLEELREEILDWKSQGLSVMEMSHRSKEVVEIAETAKQDFIDLMNIDSDYDVLFIQGGASLQFSMVPMNLLTPSNALCNYLNVGQWSKKAIKEARNTETYIFQLHQRKILLKNIHPQTIGKLIKMLHIFIWL